MDYDVNVYYNPDKCGLANIGTLDEDDLSYEYNTLIVVKHLESGRLFWTQDSGCSCPTPFEDERFTSPDDTSLEEITSSSLENFERAVNGFPTNQEERGKLIDVVRKAVSA